MAAGMVKMRDRPEAFVAWLLADRGRRALEGAALLVVFVAVAWPLARAAWLPFVDYPEHLGTIAALHGARTPAFSQFFVVDYPRTQYLLFYFLGDVLVSLFGVEGAGRATVILSVATLPLAVAVWLREHGRPPLLGALAAGIAIHTFVMWGFLNFAMGMVLALLALAALARVVRRPDALSALWLALLALATFYAHAQLFAWFGLAAIVQTAAMAPSAGFARTRRAVGYGAVAALPAVVGVLVWLRNSGVLERGVAGTRNPLAAGVGSAPPSFHPAHDTLRGWLGHSFATWTDGSGEDVALAFLFAALLLLALRGLSSGSSTSSSARPADAFAKSFRARAPLAAPIASLAPEAVLGLTFALYLFAPFSYRYIEPINERFLPLTLALLPALGARGPLTPTVRAIVAAATVSVALFASHVHGAGFARTDAEMGDLREALSHTRPGHRLLGLIFDKQSAEVPLPVYLHAHQYYQAHVGGLAAFGFVEFPISPIQYKPGAEPPPFPARFEWTPERYDHAVYGDAFDYWLIRHAPGQPAPASLFRRRAPSGAEPPAVAYEGVRWTLFARPGLER